ncbi:hypothetical protein FQA39_LY04321 [Lamprigera yunnana]|nr:hypothetical protein FQA39_LY04321 [Lamprigera yunnana]
MNYALILFLFILLQALIGSSNASINKSNDDYHCVWYGQCNERNGVHQYCPYNGTAKSIQSEGTRILAKWCPHLISDVESETRTCCDLDQIKAMDINVYLVANFLSRCPSCMHNYIQHICEMTCSPQQSRYIDVVDVKKNEAGKEYITEIDYFIGNDYVSGTFNSCKDVSVPSIGQKAFDLICGAWGAMLCTPMRLFTFFGDVENNSFAPFRVNFKNTSQSVGRFIPMNNKIFPCNKAVNDASMGCSCDDCESSCTEPKPVQSKDQLFNISEIDYDYL